MKSITNNYKENVKLFGREIDSKITYELDGDEIELGAEELNSVTPHYESSLLKSVMKQLDVDSNVEIPVGTIITYQFGVKVGNVYEYISYGNYVVYESEKQEDTRSWKITCYDKMLYSMVPYESLNITYPISVKDFLSAICTKIGIEFANANDNFVNSDKQITSELYLDSDGNSLDYTFRDVLDELAQVTASVICINDEDKLEVRYINNTGEYETVEGTNISIENVDEGKDIEYDLKGDTSQNGTPTSSSPVEIETVTGSQIINVSDGVNTKSYEINLSNIELCKMGNYQDRIYKNNGKWYLYKEIGKIVLNGSENWSRNDSQSANNTAYFFSNVIDGLIGNIDYGLSNYFAKKDSLWNNDVEGIQLTLNQQHIRLRINKTIASAVNPFKTWLSTHNTEVYYVLTTPTTTEITDTELLNQLNSVELLEGLNNISVISSNLSSPLNLTYVSELDMIDEEYLKDVNVKFGEKFGPVNAVVLSRSAESDNIYQRDEESVESNGICEVKIKDNQILNGNNRDEFLPEIFNKLNGLEYYLADYSSTGITYYDLLDRYKVKVDENYYKTIMFNDEVNVTQGLEEQVHADKLEESETDYKKSDKTDRKINQAYIIVDKQNQQINSVVQTINTLQNTVNSQGEQVEALGTQITQTIDNITASVSSIQDTLDNGVNLVKTTSVTIDDEGLSVSTDTSKIKTTMTNNEFKIVDSSNTTLAKFGYDEEEQISVAVMDNLTVENYFVAGYHRTEKMEVDGENRTGVFYIGG